MKIGIDVSTVLNHGCNVGAGRYIINLVGSLLKIDKKNSYILTGRYINPDNIKVFAELKKDYGAGKVTLKFIKTTQNKIDLWDRFRFPPIEFSGFRADLLHCPDYVIPPTLNNNIVLTIHDLAFIRFPQFNFDWFIKKYTHMVRKNSSIASKIIADSKSTAADIEKFFKIDGKKIEVVYLSSDIIFRKLPDSEINKGILNKFNITDKFLLSVGTIEPRKNYTNLIKAFNLLKSDSGSGLRYQLVIAGGTGWKSEETYSEYESSPFKKDIIFTGKISDEDLLQLYNLADIFVYPSLFEGFGLPPLEAMSCGLPVIASDSSSIKEVVDGAGLLFNPQDMNEIKKFMIRVLQDKDLKDYLSEQSLKRASQFSWEKTAEKTLKIYEEVVG